MSGLAAVLAGRHRPGVHRWESALEVHDVRAAVEHAGWRFGYVDGAGLEETPPVLRAIGALLDFPDFFTGRSLDGFHDLLRDVERPTVLLWDAWGALARAEADRFASVVQILQDRDPGDPPLEVLLRGPGPEDVVPLLA